MKTHPLPLVAALLLSAPGLLSSAHGQSLLIDFGAALTPGITTTSPDAGGLYWNNFTSALTLNASVSNLVTTANAATTIDLTLTAAFTGTNGGAGGGGLLAPSGALLGDFAVSSATQDYFFTTTNTGTLKLSQLDPTKTYEFTFFGSRDQTATRTTQYTVVGSAGSVSATLTTSGTGIGSGGVGNGNNSSFALLSGIIPDVNNEIFISVTSANASFGYLNALEISVIPEPSTYAACAGAVVLGLVVLRRRRGL